MNYRPLGKTGLQVSELSLGAARGARKDPGEFIATIHAAIASGMNFIDTAEKYEEGECERLLGQALRGRDDVIVETKYLPYENYGPHAAFNGSPNALLDAVDASLRRLQRDHVDILLAHGLRTLESHGRFMNDGCYDAMTKLRDQGKVRFIGMSELSEGDGTHEVLRTAVPSGAFDVVMLTINFLLQTAIDSILPLCHQHGVGTIVMMPLNQASANSGLTGGSQARECIRRHIARGNLPDQPPYTDPDLLDFLNPYSIPEAALRFVLSQAISSCCVGVCRPHRIEENLRAMSRPYLDDERLTRLTDLFGRIRSQVT